MFVVLLKFSKNKSKVSEFMEGHNQWIKQGFDESIFLLVGGLKPGLGESVIAHNTSLSDLQIRVNEDPFVIEDIVKPEILEIEISKTNPRLGFLND